MAKRTIKVGSTDQTVDVFIQDSSSTTGGGLTGLVFNSAGLTCYYRKGATGTPTQLPLVTQTVGGAHADGGFVAVDGTNCPGQYRLDLSDTMVASGGMLTIYLKGATNMAPVLAEIEVVAYDPFDGVRLGLTALPNTTPGASNGLLISGPNTGTTTFGALTSTGAFTVGSVVNNGVTDVAQTGDSFARIGATGSGLTSVAPALTALSTLQWTNDLATALGTLASHDPGATLASQTNITAGTITTVTNVTTVNGLANNVITAASIATDAGTELATAVWALGTRTLTAFAFPVDIGYINGAAVTGDGTVGDPWGPA